jgi:aminopeptidase
LSAHEGLYHMHPRVDRLAEIIVGYSLKVKTGDRVVIVCDGLEGKPLVQSLHKQCIQKMARHVEYMFRDSSILRDFLTFANDDQLAYFPPEYLSIIKDTDVYVWIGAPSNTKELALVDEARQSLHRKALSPLREERLRGTRWMALLYPTQALAQDANMSLEEFSNFFFDACLKDWAAEKEKMSRLKHMLRESRTVTITGSGTELTFGTGNREPVCCAGEVNLPDGEIFIGPDRNSVQGTIRFNMPGMYQGKVFHDIELVFKDGKVIRESSRNDSAELTKILDTDEGSRYLGEFAIGLNHQINRQFFNPLFDEKIFGTVHMALGHCFPQSDNGNQSSIHWDLIYSLAGEGELFFDNELIMKDGQFVHKKLVHFNA